MSPAAPAAPAAKQAFPRHRPFEVLHLPFASSMEFATRARQMPVARDRGERTMMRTTCPATRNEPAEDRRRRRRNGRPGDASAAPERAPGPLRGRCARRAVARRSATRCAHGSGSRGSHADWRSLLDATPLDAVLIASPAGTHVEIVLAALEAGLHVFCEKPLAITLADIDRSVGARDRAGRVVQVGYMKRHDPAFQRALEEMPESAAELRYVSIVVNDPEWLPYFLPGDILRGTDVPRRDRRLTPGGERAGRAGGRPRRPGGVLRVLGRVPRLARAPRQHRQRLPRADGRAAVAVVDGAWWNGGRSVAGYCVLANGVALGQRLDPAARHARVPRVDPALLRHLDSVADVSRRRG